MKKIEIEKRINDAMDHAAPNVLEDIIKTCGEPQKQENIIMPATKKKSKTVYKFCKYGAMAAVLAVVLFGTYKLGAGSGVLSEEDNTRQQNSTEQVTEDNNAIVNQKVDSVVLLDVNPSFSIDVSQDEKVIAVKTLNDDAKKVLGTMELENISLDVAVNALVGSMIQNGYLSDIQNSILVSVENSDAEKGARLQEKITSAIDKITAGDGTELSVLSQVVNATDDELKLIAAKYNISLGKAALIQEAMAQDSNLTFDKLASMSINEIAIIMNSKEINTNLNQTGQSSTKAYISREEAYQIAYNHAGVQESEIGWKEIEYDSDDGMMVYEVEFNAGNDKYEYEINAKTGDIIEYKSDISSRPTDNTSETYIDRDTAKNIAFTHANVSEASVRELEIELDTHENPPVYEIDFKVGNMEYEYEIHAVSGSVIDYEAEED